VFAVGIVFLRLVPPISLLALAGFGAGVTFDDALPVSLRGLP